MNISKPKIIAIQRPPKPTAQTAAEPANSKSGSQRDENLKEKPSKLSPNSEPAKPTDNSAPAEQPQAEPQLEQQAIPKPKKKPTDQKPQPELPANQSLGLFVGHLGIEGEKLQFICPDGTSLPITGINQNLALRLMSHPSEMFSTELSNWLVHPRADFRTKQLAIRLHGKLQPGKAFSIEPEQAIVRGKLVAVEEDKLIVAIRRNISRETFQELQRKGMIRGEFEQFTVIVHGSAPVEVGQVVELNCRKEGDRLVVINQ